MLPTLRDRSCTGSFSKIVMKHTEYTEYISTNVKYENLQKVRFVGVGLELALLCGLINTGPPICVIIKGF